MSTTCLLAILLAQFEVCSAGTGTNDSGGSSDSNAGKVLTWATFSSAASGSRVSVKPVSVSEVVCRSVFAPVSNVHGVEEVPNYQGKALALDEFGAAVLLDGDVAFRLYLYSCSDGRVWTDYQRLPQQIDRQALIAQARAEVTRQVPLPVLAMAPAPELGVPANVGLWLAIYYPGEVQAHAQAGPVWAVVTATLVSTSWDMGNGDIVECTGFGQQRPDYLDGYDYSQGPCGYTFRNLSDKRIHTMSVTAHWQVQLQTSDGDNHTLTPINRTTTFNYNVYELITVNTPCCG
jgi:hypothetical protein